jgi:hypothetical protein
MNSGEHAIWASRRFVVGSGREPGPNLRKRWASLWLHGVGDLMELLLLYQAKEENT